METGLGESRKSHFTQIPDDDVDDDNDGDVSESSQLNKKYTRDLSPERTLLTPATLRVISKLIQQLASCGSCGSYV